MPIYEYICRRCGRKNEFLVFPWENETLKCKKCGSEDLERIMSRFGTLTSEEQRIERTVESAMREVDFSNPESIKGWMKKTLKEYSDEIGSDVDVEEAVESFSEEISKASQGESESSEKPAGEESSSESKTEGE